MLSMLRDLLVVFHFAICCISGIGHLKGSIITLTNDLIKQNESNLGDYEIGSES